MARQAGIITLDGSIDNISFFKTKNGYSARKKTGVSAEQIATNPNFARTRENMAEFTRAAKSSKLLRSALSQILAGSKDGRMVARLTSAMMEVVKSDATSTRGKRNVMDGETELLNGFDFNLTGKLSATLLAPFTATIDRVLGKGKLSVPSFDAERMFKPAKGSTHYRFGIAIASIDFENEVVETDTLFSAYTPLETTPTALVNLEVSVTPASTHPLFLAFTIEFVQQTNGEMYALSNGEFNPCALVKVDGGV